jgi:hypothetical protein
VNSAQNVLKARQAGSELDLARETFDTYLLHELRRLE